MFARFHLKIVLPVITLVLLLAACGFQPPASGPSTTEEPNVLYTAAAQTVVAQLTQAAGSFNPTNTPNAPAPTATQVIPTQPPAATATLAPTATQVPPTATAPVVPTVAPVVPTATKTPVPQPTATKAPTEVPLDTSCYKATFVEDVNYPDNTDVYAGSTIYKTWKIKNAGSCTWNENFSLVYWGGDLMGSPKVLPWTFGDVPKNHTVEITIAFKVPTDAGTYRSEWEIRNPKGQYFGVTKSSGAMVPIYVKIDVVKVKVNYDFVAKANTASWTSNSGAIRWGFPQREPALAAIKDSLLMEDGLTYGNVLATYPEDIDNGYVAGVYTPYTVKDGDKFVAEFGFRYDAGDGASVRYSLRYVVNGTVYTLKEWTKDRDGKLDSVKVDLSSLAGQTVQFMLYVDTNGSPMGDLVGWINPRIQK